MENKKKIIIIIISLLVIAGFVFLYTKNNKQEKVVQEDNSKNEELNLENTDKKDVIESVEKQVDTKKYQEFMDLGDSSVNKKDYNSAISYYNKALSFGEKDVVYAKIYNAYLANKDIKNATIALNKAITINPSYTLYHIWSLESQSSIVSYDKLVEIYKNGYSKSIKESKINLITTFARMSENLGKKQEAIELWKDAQIVSPDKKDMYQLEIDRLSSKN